MTCGRQTWVGAYVLDALEPEETLEVREHITGCPICQDEVVMLSWVPAMLHTLALEDVERLDDDKRADGHPDSPVLDGLLAAARAARGRRRWRRPVAALVAAVAIVAAVALGRGQHTDILDRNPVAVHTVDSHSQVHAAVTLSRRTWGTEVHLTLRGVAPGEHCSLVAHSRDGRRDVAATWVATYRGTADVPGMTAIPLDQLREVDVVTADGRQLARLAVPNQNK
jgi:hypothetical protein